MRFQAGWFILVSVIRLAVTSAPLGEIEFQLSLADPRRNSQSVDRAAHQKHNGLALRAADKQSL